MCCFVVVRTRDLFFTSADCETPKKVGKYNINNRKVSAVLHDMISNVLFQRMKVSRVEFRLWIEWSGYDSWRPHLVTLPPAFRIYRVCCHAMEAEIQPGETVSSLELFLIYFGIPFVFIFVRQSLMKCENETVAPEHSLHQVFYHASAPAPPLKRLCCLNALLVHIISSCRSSIEPTVLQ